MEKVYSPSGFYVGLSGLALPIPKYKFPEEFQKSTRLTYYATLLNSIEINRSFYALPNAKTVARWATEVPDHFRFTFKLWKAVTHTKGLQFETSDVIRFMNAIDSVGHKKGCLLIQFPASLKSVYLLQLAGLLELIHANNPESEWKIAIEFRDRSWYQSDTYDVVTSYNATIVVHDKWGTAPPVISSEAGTMYLRFHGPEGNYRGSYTDSFLHEYAGYVHEWLSEGKSVFAHFNNTMGSAFNDATTLGRYIRE